MSIGTQTTAPFVPLHEFTASISAAEVLLFCRDLRGTLIDAAVAASGRALSLLPSDTTAATDAGVGIAVETREGTVVPVVRNAGDGLLPCVRDEVSRLVDAARTGRLGASDLGAPAVTVSDNPSLHGAARLHARSCLLGVQGPEPGSDRVTLSLMIDGEIVKDEARSFFATVVRALRHPYRLLV